MTSHLFTAEDIIHTYSRAQALADGVLIDVTATAAEAGFRWPVAMTAGAWAHLVAWDPANRAIQDESARLWDVCWVARWACRTARPGAPRILAKVVRVPNTPRAWSPVSAWFAIHVGPGDQGEPVVTITLRDED